MKNKKGFRKIFNMNLLIGFIMASFILSIVFVTIRLILSPTVPDAMGERSKSDYVLMLLQCVLGIFALMLPGFLMKKVKIMIPSYMIIAYALFLYCAIYLGEVRAFYYNVPNWDTILHAFSGMMLAALGFSFISILNRSERVPMNLSPAFVACFTLCFAVTLGVIWEVYEFLADIILHTNMQKYAFEDGTLKIGNAALFDTMKDLITDFIGALVIAIIGYISQKTRKNYLEKFQVRVNVGAGSESESGPMDMPSGSENSSQDTGEKGDAHKNDVTHINEAAHENDASHKNGSTRKNRRRGGHKKH